LRLNNGRCPFKATYFSQNIIIPGLSIGTARVFSQLDSVPLPGDSFSRQNLQVQFKVDEDYKNYDEIYDWMVSLVAPDEYSQYGRLAQNDRNSKISSTGVVSDIAVVVNNSSQTPNRQYQFYDAWPNSLSQLDYSTVNGESVLQDATVTFEFRHMVASPSK
jgi:hypothetical protein